MFDCASDNILTCSKTILKGSLESSTYNEVKEKTRKLNENINKTAEDNSTLRKKLPSCNNLSCISDSNNEISICLELDPDPWATANGIQPSKTNYSGKMCA